VVLGQPIDTGEPVGLQGGRKPVDFVRVCQLSVKTTGSGTRTVRSVITIDLPAGSSLGRVPGALTCFR